MKQSFLILLLLSATVGILPATGNPVVPVPASARTAAIQVRVTPDQPGWTCPVGEPVKFRIEATADNEMLTGATVRYSAGPEMLPAVEQTAALPAGGLVIDAGTMSAPGFLRCIARVEYEGKIYRGLATVGFSPEIIQPTQVQPPDFDAFWAAQKEVLAQVPHGAEMKLRPDLGTAAVEVYNVSFQNVAATPGGPPTRIYGILTIPKRPGTFPAILKVPGAGVRAHVPWSEAGDRVITLVIGIHGIPVDLAPELYEQLRIGALSDYRVSELADRERYYFRRVYLGCIRANDFLSSLPQFDGKNLAVTGGSQGGQLAIVTAALDPRVQALGCYFPAYCDVTGYLHGRAGGWPHLMKPEKDGRPSRHATPEKIATTAYYDTVNFARRLQVPGCYSWGYNDETCPPTTMFAAYNVITAPKQLLLTLELGHASIPEQHDRVMRFVFAQLGVNTD